MLPQTDFLDATLDLTTGKYWPFRKPNNELQYVHVGSNHPPSILKQLPHTITNRIASLSCNAEEYEKALPAYKDALERSGHQHPTTTTPPVDQTAKTGRQRKRNIIWFNPPYNSNVSTNVGAQFLRLIDRHFPKNHPYSKLFNRGNVKVSYSTMQNMGSIIASHNAKILSPPPATTPADACNCNRSNPCPLDGQCKTSCIVYKATVSVPAAPTEPTMVYYGLTEGEFKKRYSNHKSSFRLATRRNETELAKHMWALKDRGLTGEITWEIAKRSTPYKCGTRRCDLCLTEKLLIATADTSNLLNKRSELISTCRHKNKFRCSRQIPPISGTAEL